MNNMDEWAVKCPPEEIRAALVNSLNRFDQLEEYERRKESEKELYFQALALACDFNRKFPHLLIPAMVEGKTA